MDRVENIDSARAGRLLRSAASPRECAGYARGLPAPQGLYDPRNEKDSCGVGFVCNIKGGKSNKIVRQGIEVLKSLAHRGATGSDPKTGDGAGILIQMPHDFLFGVCKQDNIGLPGYGDYGTGLVFLPRDKEEREECKKTVDDMVKKEGQSVLWWRKVPVDNSVIGHTAKETEPAIEQVFIQKAAGTGQARGAGRISLGFCAQPKRGDRHQSRRDHRIPARER